MTEPLTPTAAEPVSPAGHAEVSPEPAARNARRALVLLFVLAALGTRFYRLAERPLHHDESIHAFQSYTLAKDGNWRYDPAYHGPFLYYANALVYKMVGLPHVTNTTARFLPAVFGLILIGFAWPLSRWIGKPAAAAYALLVLTSPHLTYFSRFIREDLYSLVFTYGTILAFRYFLETGRDRWLTAAAVFFALAGVTKENAYMTGVLFVLFGLWALSERALVGRPAAAAFRSAVTETFVWVRRHFVPLLTAGVVFLFIWALMYSAFGKYPGDWLAIPKAVKYWMGQHAIARIPGPWYYYFPQLSYYETVILFLVPLAFSREQWRRDPFLRSILLVIPVFFLVLALSLSGTGQALTSRPFLLLGAVWVASLFLAPRLFGPAQITLPPFIRFLAFWSVASLAIYGWAREKVPWLTVHPLVPLTILAAISLAELWRDRANKRSRLALLIAGVLLAVNTSGMVFACFRYGAHDLEKEPRHAEMLAYVQTSRDLVRALESVEKAKPRVAPGQPLITVAGEATWPLTWYLRDVTTRWVGRVEDASTPIIVADWDPEGALQKQLADRYNSRRVPIRAWWFPEKIQPTSENSFVRPTLSDIIQWWLFHEIWSPIGSQDAMFYVRKDLEQGTGPLAPLTLTVQDTSAREYPSEATVLPPARVWGGPGAGQGQFAEPRGLATDARGNLYVADTKNSRIQVFDGNGQFVREFGSKGQGNGQLNEPCGLTVDSQGEIWVADTWNHRIVRFNPEGKFVSSFVDTEKAFFGPRAILASKNVLYVADTGNKRIVRFDREGNKLSEWGGNGIGPGQFVEPVGLAADPSGKLYVADTGNHRVQVFDAEGKFVRQFPMLGWKDFYTEPHLAIGPSDTVFATDSVSGRIAQYDSSGAFRRSWKSDKDFKQPTGIALDSFGRLMVSDRGTHRIFSWTLGALP